MAELLQACPLPLSAVDIFVFHSKCHLTSRFDLLQEKAAQALSMCDAARWVSLDMFFELSKTQFQQV